MAAGRDGVSDKVDVPEFGVLLRACRLAARLTQEGLAQRAGVSARTVGDLERGRVRTPRPASVLLLADALELTGAERGRFEQCGQEAYWQGRATADPGAAEPGRPDSGGLGVAEPGRAAVLSVARPAPATGTEPDVPGRADRPGPTGQRAGAGPVDAPVWQLPPDLPDYLGRRAEIAAMTGCLSPGGRPSRTALPVAAVSGQGGVGKTALAVHVAHLLRADFPDGQLFVSLRGGGPRPVSTDEVLARLLRSLGVPEAQLSGGLEDKVERYRVALAGRRMLVILDDAAAAGQVRPLLPGEPGCGVIVTSRRHLAGLEGATSIGLTVLPDPVALALLGRLVGADRMDRDPGSGRQLVRLCGALPLAVRIAGARLAARPHWPVSRLVERMSDERRRLDELVAEDLAVRASIGVSYHVLDPASARVFRWIGQLDAPDFAAWMVAALLEISQRSAADLLDRLVDAQLLDVTTTAAGEPQRYRMHDLIRLYAREQAELADTEPDRRRAIARVAHAALSIVASTAEPPPVAIADVRRARLAPRPRPEPSTMSPAKAAAWFATEEPALVATVEQAARLGLDELAYELATALVSSSFSIANRSGRWGYLRRQTQAAGSA